MSSLLAVLPGCSQEEAKVEQVAEQAAEKVDGAAEELAARERAIEAKPAA